MENKNTATTTTTENENTTTTNNENRKEEKNMENKNSKNNKNNKNMKKEGEKNMKTAENIKNKSITENKNNAFENFERDEKELVNLLNHVSREKRGIASRKVKEKRKTVNASLKEYNDFQALEYYKNNTLIDIVKAGDKVPVLTITEHQKEDGTFEIVRNNENVYPTLSGMVKAGVIKSDVIDTIDLLRRMVAYLAGDEKILTGDTVTKKDIPNKNVSELIKMQGDISANKARKVMRVLLKELTGNEFDKDVFPVFYNDFAKYITKRGKAWGTRTAVGKATANDIVLEYVHMSITGKTAFTMVIE